MCNYCDLDLESKDVHWNHYCACHAHCDGCNRWARNAQTLKVHKVEDHYYCEACDQIFLSRSNLNAHLKSSTHQPMSYKCPFCPRQHVSPPAVLQHMESGTCGSGITRADVDRYAAKWGCVRQYISSSKKSHANSAPTVPAPLIPPSIPANQCWDGSTYTCPLCNRRFLHRGQLEQHLTSPKHTKRVDQLYICRESGCGMKFEVLSGLMQHLVNANCGSRRRAAADASAPLMSGFMRMAL